MGRHGCIEDGIPPIVIRYLPHVSVVKETKDENLPLG